MVGEVGGPGGAGEGVVSGAVGGKNREFAADALSVLREAGELLARSSSVLGVDGGAYTEMAARCRLAAAELEAVLHAAFERDARPRAALPDAFRGFAAGYAAGEVALLMRQAAERDEAWTGPLEAMDLQTALALYRMRVAKGQG